MVDIYIYICSIHGVYKPTFTSRLGGPHGYYFDGFETTSRLMGGFTAHTERWAMGKTRFMVSNWGFFTPKNPNEIIHGY